MSAPSPVGDDEHGAISVAHGLVQSFLNGCFAFRVQRARRFCRTQTVSQFHSHQQILHQSLEGSTAVFSYLVSLQGLSAGNREIEIADCLAILSQRHWGGDLAGPSNPWRKKNTKTVPKDDA